MSLPILHTAVAAPPARIPGQRRPLDSCLPTPVRDDVWTRQAAAAAGDHAAFAALHATLAPRITEFLRNRVPAEAVEDLAADVFARAWAGIGGWRDTGIHPYAWWYRIARNLIADHHARTARRPATLPLDEDLAARLADTTPGPEAVVMATAAGVVVREVVDRLSPIPRACIRLRYLGGLTAGQAAGIMGYTEPAIRAIGRRALGHLRDLLADEGVDRPWW